MAEGATSFQPVVLHESVCPYPYLAALDSTAQTAAASAGSKLKHRDVSECLQGRDERDINRRQSSADVVSL